jgi:EAL domain-containing protein (putative c-di-GMP-specific phosphodiesterase class I)
VSTIVQLARSLRLDVVAEGVETSEQLALLRALECEKVQGFLFAEPLTSDAARILLATQGVR